MSTRTPPRRPALGAAAPRPALAVAALAAAAACATPTSARGPRFANQPIAWRVNDRADVPVQPKPRPFAQKVYFFDAFVYDPVAHALRATGPRHALDVNALDEVPDSSWFENRIGRRPLSLDDLRRGPNTVAADASRWTVLQSKTVGGSAGFIATDGRGDRYVIKLDEPQAPVTESATDVAIQRLLWAIGYHVPENSVIYLRPEQIALGPKAVVKDEFGNERRMVPRDLEATLARGYRKPDGTYRALASKYLAGKPLGGWAQQGVRPDDPNDQIPHEHRRAVRGLYLFFAWLQQTDVKEDNTLDMWTTDPATGHRYVKHHLVDFGKSLGMSAWIALRPGDGHQQNVDFPYLLRGIASLGLWVRPYEGTLTPGIQGVGTFDADHFDPGAWRPHAGYEPLRFLDERDVLWAGAIIARFTRAQIRAAIEQGRYEDPRAVDYLVDVLVARQRKVVHWAFTRRVAPLGAFALEEGGLCFDDLLVASGLRPGAAATTAYGASATGYDGQRLAWAPRPDTRGARTCLPAPPRGPDRDGYAILRVATRRAGAALGDVEVHVADAPDGRPRIIGLHRHAPR
jgi:hypothetical protein